MKTLKDRHSEKHRTSLHMCKNDYKALKNVFLGKFAQGRNFVFIMNVIHIALERLDSVSVAFLRINSNRRQLVEKVNFIET